MNYSSELEAKKAEVEEIIKSYLPKEEGFQKTIFEAMNYSILVGGKRLRPMIMRETYYLFGGNTKEIEPFMAAMEMIHTFSLVHDDLPSMDNDEYRRGKKTTWAQYGEDMGVLAGDALAIYAFEVCTKSFTMTDNVERVGKAMAVLANKTGIYGMIGGQTVDVELTDKVITKPQLDFIYKLKTGALLEASMMIGAILAGASCEEIGIIEDVAAKVGLAFQIRDDILDVISTTEVLGKPVLSDEKNNKTTYVTLEGLEQSKNLVDKISKEAMQKLKSLNKRNEFLEALIEALINREK